MLGNGTTTIPKDEFNEEVEFLGASVSVTFSGGSANTSVSYTHLTLPTTPYV